MTSILEWLGFPAVRCSGWVPYPDTPDLERLVLIASRSPDPINQFEANRDWQNIMDFTIPRQASVIVVEMAPTPAEERTNERGPPRIRNRRRLGFPSSDDSRFAPDDPTDDHEAIRQFEELTEEADYLLVRSGDEWWFDRYPLFYRHIQDKYQLVTNEKGKCMIFKLRAGT
jgi:hypothetical protein